MGISSARTFRSQTATLPGAGPRSDRFRSGGRESNFLAVGPLFRGGFPAFARVFESKVHTRFAQGPASRGGTRRAWLRGFALGLAGFIGLPALAVEPRFFRSPEAAVREAEALVRAKDWSTLAAYYDLTGTRVARADLEEGRFFLRTERPPGADPMGFWKIRHPFPPGFRYSRVEKTATPGTLRVWVAIEIDQGGGPPQRSVMSFLVRQFPVGFQILPPEETKTKQP